MTRFFYDSYAIIEFVNGNEKFKVYFLENEGITTIYNVMEVYYSVLREESEEKAKKALELLKSLIIYPTLDDVEEAMKFRLKFKNKRLSYADCLGYFLAKKTNIKFLTGDDGFKDLPNVEFVKA